MARVKTFGSEQSARDFAASVDSALGLPRVEDPAQGGLGVRVGVGRHVPWDKVVTEHQHNLFRDGSTWAYPVDGAVESVDGAQGVAVGQTVERPIHEWTQVPLPDAVPVDVEPGRGARR